MNTSTAAHAAATATTVREALPVRWTDQDETFFRIVRELFSPAYLQGASVLLAGYDAEPGPA